MHGEGAAASGVEEDVLAPKDHYQVVYLVTVLLGMGCLFPWTSIIACLDFFNKVYGKWNFAFDIGVAYMYPLILVIILMLVFPGRVSLPVRVYAPFLIFLGVFVVLPIAATLFSPFIGFLVSMLCTVVVGLADAVSQASLFGWAGMLPAHYVQALNFGTGVSGLFDAILRIISKVAFTGPHSERQSVALFFSLSGAVTIMCILSFYFVSRHSFTRWYVQRAEEHARVLRTDATVLSVGEVSPLVAKPAHAAQSFNYIEVLSRIQKPAFFCAMSYCVQFALSPGVTTHIPPHGRLSKDWFTIYLILIGAIGDFTGKLCARFRVINRLFSDTTLFLLTAVLRMAAIPLVMWCFVPPVQSNWFTWGVSFFNQVCNGYLATRMLMIGVDMVPPGDKEAAGTIMLFALQGGLTVGSSISLVLPFVFHFSQ